MKLLVIASLIIGLPLLTLAQSPRKAFPYDYRIDDLPNGLRVVTVPTDYPNLVALYIVVQTGSRNEPEPGKSGYAHLFEHLMFRGSEHYTGQQRDEVLRKQAPIRMRILPTIAPSITKSSPKTTWIRSSTLKPIGFRD